MSQCTLICSEPEFLLIFYPFDLIREKSTKSLYSGSFTNSHDDLTELSSEEPHLENCLTFYIWWHNPLYYMHNSLGKPITWWNISISYTIYSVYFPEMKYIYFFYVSQPKVNSSQFKIWLPQKWKGRKLYIKISFWLQHRSIHFDSQYPILIPEFITITFVFLWNVAIEQLY